MEKAAKLAKKVIIITKKAKENTGLNINIHNLSPNTIKLSDIPILKTEDIPNTTNLIQIISNIGNINILILLSNSDNTLITASAADSAQITIMPKGNIDRKNIYY